jgi:hypothetical protein
LSRSHSALTTVVSDDGEAAIARVGGVVVLEAREVCVRGPRGRCATMKGDARASAADIKRATRVGRCGPSGAPGRTFRA